MATKNSALKSLIVLGVVFASIFLISPAFDLFARTQQGSGTRSGVVVKLSYKGRINRSWEGELMLGGVQSGETWAFSLDPLNPDTSAIARQLQSAELERTSVTLHYQQRFIAPWRTDTNYLVSGFVAPQSAQPSPAR